MRLQSDRAAAHFVFSIHEQELQAAYDAHVVNIGALCLSGCCFNYQESDANG